MSSGMTIVSAPGKVLLAGGYLVLDPLYTGVVVSTSSRFYTIIRESKDGSPGRVIVKSPQFIDATWEYEVSFSDEGVLKCAPSLNSSSTNKFVHLALERTILVSLEASSVKVLSDVLAKGLIITIMGDNDFYSQRSQLKARNLPPTMTSLAQLPRFVETNVHLTEVHKTGLGSSASLITSLVSALLVHFSVIQASDLSEPTKDTESYSTGRKLAHNVAQYIHCLAQGKVGSGFDVASAAFGSQLYSRFDPKVIEPLMVDHIPTEPLLPILSPANMSWNHRVTPFKLPPLTRLMLGDVDAGSDTPSLVGQVLRWRKQNPSEALALWTNLGELNDRLATAFKDLGTLHNLYPIEYQSAVQLLSDQVADKWQPVDPPKQALIVESFVLVHQLSEKIRSKMREMGVLAGVPIEPKEQTELLNACQCEAGVIAGGVPGAGGYDALWLLVFDDSNVMQGDQPLNRVQRLWSDWRQLSISPLSATESLESGARIERPEDFSDFI